MTQVSHKQRTRILPPSPIAPEEKSRRQEQRDTLAMRCRVVFERLPPQFGFTQVVAASYSQVIYNPVFWNA